MRAIRIQHNTLNIASQQLSALSSIAFQYQTFSGSAIPPFVMIYVASRSGQSKGQIVSIYDDARTSLRGLQTRRILNFGNTLLPPALTKEDTGGGRVRKDMPTNGFAAIGPSE